MRSKHVVAGIARVAGVSRVAGVARVAGGRKKNILIVIKSFPLPTVKCTERSHKHIIPG